LNNIERIGRTIFSRPYCFAIFNFTPLNSEGQRSLPRSFGKWYWGGFSWGDNHQSLWPGLFLFTIQDLTPSPLRNNSWNKWANIILAPFNESTN
jgi:hypothetical protein